MPFTLASPKMKYSRYSSLDGGAVVAGPLHSRTHSPHASPQIVPQSLSCPHASTTKPCPAPIGALEVHLPMVPLAGPAGGGRGEGQAAGTVQVVLKSDLH